MNSELLTFNLDNDELFYLQGAASTIAGSETPILFDIGANIGDFSYVFLSMFPNAKIYAFEPVPEIFNNLKERFKNFDNFEYYNLALSRTKGEKEFYYIKNSIGMSSLYYRPEHFPRFQTEKIIVKTDKLDNLAFPKNMKIDYMKIDTEGSEMSVLEGALETIKEKSPSFIQWEYGGCYLDSKITGKEIIKLLEKLGYATSEYVSLSSTKTLYPVHPDNFREDYSMRNLLSIKKSLGIYK
jgi:FkbM family methyltransferase